MHRDNVLHKVRTALGRSAGQPAPPPPDVYFNPAPLLPPERIALFKSALEALAGRVFVAADRDQARGYVANLIAGRTAVTSNSAFVEACGIRSIPGVSGGITDRAALRELCATCDFGITSADYGLANTGTLVMIASAEEPRLVSLLPPVHVAVIPCSRLLSGLEELFTILPRPADGSSSMVFITGPSRTADIEQILVRGVHGPGEIHVVLVETE